LFRRLPRAEFFTDVCDPLLLPVEGRRQAFGRRVEQIDAVSAATSPPSGGPDGLVIVGWNELGDMSRAGTKEELRALIARADPEGGKARIANWTGQLWRFRAVIEVGDHVVMPVKSRGTIAIGRVTGPYAYRADGAEGFRQVRPVQWLRTDIPRDAVKQDLLDSMGSLLTVCGLNRADADARIAPLAGRFFRSGTPSAAPTPRSSGSRPIWPRRG
jgi:restriction system protein